MAIPVKWWKQDLNERISSGLYLESYAVADTDIDPPCKSFMVDVDGTLVVDGVLGGTEITLTVLAGVQYAIGLSAIYASSSGPTTVIAIY